MCKDSYGGAGKDKFDNGAGRKDKSNKETDDIGARDPLSPTRGKASGVEKFFNILITGMTGVEILILKTINNKARELEK